MKLHWFPISVIALVVALVIFVLVADSRDRAAQKQLPAGTLFFKAYMGNQHGSAAITPDGHRWFRADGTYAFQEVKP